MPTLDELRADPTLAAGLPEPVRLRLLMEAEGIAGVLRDAGSRPTGSCEGESTEMLTADEAAALAHVSRKQFYRTRRFRSAIVAIGHRTRLVNKRKLLRVLAGERI